MDQFGSGLRIAGGWQLADVSLPATGTIRARGYATGGQWNASGWFVESLASLSTIGARTSV